MAIDAACKVQLAKRALPVQAVLRITRACYLAGGQAAILPPYSLLTLGFSTPAKPCSLLRAWMGLAVSEWPPPAAGEAPQPLAAFDSLHRVEGTALVLLCSTDVEVSNCFAAFLCSMGVV